jgi:hypothetical protein
MKQFDVPDEMKIPFDYSDKDLPVSVKTFRPVVFRDGDSFCVVFGPNPQAGVFGRGNTPKEAVADWDKKLYHRIKEHKKEDEVAKFVIDTISSSDFNI